MLLAALILLAPGCGESPEFNKAASYTPESLAQELAFRYNALSPAAKASTRTRRPAKKAMDSKADEKSSTKSQVKAATKKDLPKTIDDILDDIEAKAGLIKGMPRSEVIVKMIDALSKDSSLRESDRQVLAGKLRE
jgi:hypothetical protein